MKKSTGVKLTSKLVEAELDRVEYQTKYFKLLKNTIFSLIVVASVSTIIATFLLSVLEINGSSMNPTLNEGQIVLAFKSESVERNDLIAFYQGNKILVKRVIALQGDYVTITEDGDVYVNQVLVNEPYVDAKSLGNSNIEYPFQVPDDSYFVLGDKRDTSIDSRNSTIGTISDDDVIGKVKLGIWPLNKLGILK